MKTPIEKFFEAAGVKVPQQYLNEGERGSISLTKYYISTFIGGRAISDYKQLGTANKIETAIQLLHNYINGEVIDRDEDEETEDLEIEWQGWDDGEKNKIIWVGLDEGEGVHIIAKGRYVTPEELDRITTNKTPIIQGQDPSEI
jgi:hypothetical protein